MKKIFSKLRVLMNGTRSSINTITCNDNETKSTSSIIKINLTKLPSNVNITNALVGNVDNLKINLVKILQKSKPEFNSLKTNDITLSKVGSTTSLTPSDIITNNNFRITVAPNPTSSNIKGWINITINLSVNNDLKTVINNKNLNAIEMIDDTPTKQELLIAINANNNETTTNFTTADFDFKLGTITPTSATIIGKNNYQNEIKLTYKKAKIDLLTIIAIQNLGEIDMNNRQLPNKKTIWLKIVILNKLDNFSIVDFVFKPGTISPTNVTIVGTNQFKGEVTLTYTKK